MTTIPLFNGFYDGLYRFLQSVSVSDEYLLRYHSYWRRLTSIWCQNDRKYAKSSIWSCKWPQYHFSMVSMMVYISSCSLLVCQMNIYWDSAHIDLNWCQFNVKMIENTQNRQFLPCSWPQYQYSVVFTMVYISFCNLLVCHMNIYWNSTHNEVIWCQFDIYNDRKCAKLFNKLLLISVGW